jgi:hypothetical protein
MIRLLIDPRLLNPIPEVMENRSRALQYWESIVDWSRDKRAVLGVHSRDLLSETFAAVGYPEHTVPVAIPALRGPCCAAINAIMTRVLVSGGDVEGRTFLPRYLGTDDELLALQMDVSSSAANGVIGIATSPTNWEKLEFTVKVLPPPPMELLMCFDPSAELDVERDDSVKEFCGSKRVFIVGGRPDRTSMRRLEALGIAERNVEWIKSEKTQRPQDLDKKWSGLNPERDITLCITGRIGHPQAEKAKTLADRRGVLHLMGHSANDAISALENHAMKSVLKT